METNGRREKKFAYAAAGLYFLGWLFVLRTDTALALLTYGIVGYLTFQTIPREAENYKQQRGEVIFVIVVCIGPALGALWISKRDSAAGESFRNYLAQHNCDLIGSTVTGITRGGCDRYGNCIDPEEIEEYEFYCRTTRKRITFSGYQKGNYGN